MRPAPALAPALAPAPALALALALLAAPALADGAGAIVAADLRPGWRAADGTHVAALHLRLAPGWKTYWRAPGDAGIPPAFDWTGSRNVGAVEAHWPRPRILWLNGMRTLGFADELVLPLRVVPADPGAPLHLAASVDLGVCREICVPATVAVAADLPAPGEADLAIRAALADRPLTGAEAGVTGQGCRVEPAGDGLRVTSEIEVPPLGPGEMAVIEAGDAAVWVRAAHAVRQGGRIVASAEVVPLTAAPVVLDRARITVTLLAEGRAVELSGCPAR